MKIIPLLLCCLILKTVVAQEIQLLYFTDAHQLYELDDVPGGRGGVARLKYVVNQAKQTNPDLLTIHGGDFVGGVLYGGIYKGRHMLQAFNHIPVDIFNFGQHEFDYGVDHLIGLIDKAKGQFFSSNLVGPDGSPFHQVPKTLVRSIQGKNLLFIGLTDQMNTTKKDPRVKAADIQESVASVLEIYQQTAIDFIIVLTQMDLAKNRSLAKEFPQISLILTEELDEYESQINYVGGVPIVATAGNMSAVARIGLQEQHEPQITIIPLDAHAPKDSLFAELEKKEHAGIKILLKERLADLQIDLSALDGLDQESLAGNLITDAMRAIYQTDFALIDGSGIRNSVRKGDFTLEKVRRLLPYGNKIMVVQIKGKDLKSYISSQLQTDKPKLMQISGFSYHWNKETGKTDFPILTDGQIYSLALSDYNFGKLRDFEAVIIDADHPKSLADYEVLKAYIKKQKVIRPVLSGRIFVD